VKPYYESGGITIYHGDCREILSKLPKDAADTVVTDPPYGVGMKAFDDDFLAAVGGFLMAPGQLAAVFMSPSRLMSFTQSVAASWTYERLLWMHKTADMAAPSHGWCMNSEAILIYSRKGARWPKQGNYRSDVYSVGPWERAGHPNGKPIEVVLDLIRRLGGKTVIDPFCGSGTTLRAAKDLGLNAIGIEKEERYCEMAAARMAQENLSFIPDATSTAVVRSTNLPGIGSVESAKGQGLSA